MGKRREIDEKHLTFEETLRLIGKHDAAMMVKWFLAPARSHSQNTAPNAYALGLFHAAAHGLTKEGCAFAVEHMRRSLAEIDDGVLPARVREVPHV